VDAHVAVLRLSRARRQQNQRSQGAAQAERSRHNVPHAIVTAISSAAAGPEFADPCGKSMNKFASKHVFLSIRPCVFVIRPCSPPCRNAAN
jgi:hypothetical protein